MLIQIRTDHNTHGTDNLTAKFELVIAESLERFAQRITRVEVHLSDDNGVKNRGDDKRCVLEVRPAHMQPVSVSNVGASFEQAVEGAARKMVRHLDDTFEKLKDRARKPERDQPAL